MAVEDQSGGEDGSLDRFPVGMRVLAVDDDPICLKLLEILLQKCRYQVTVTNQAIKALNMLRENRNKFDLVISDVNMPDMDGFKLLELVGLEMDLPVIMLSAHSDTKLVMKGVTHGACDYLLKPVRIEELRNIWQHVVRRRKSDTKDQSKFPDHVKPCHETREGRKGVTTTGNEDQNAKLTGKRKDQKDDEEEEGEENGHKNEDPSTQKKARVVWSPELHRKFVAAVHQLGVDKAFPKKILDLMNVGGLTRENVASHLQKYRAYLKRISTESPQASGVAALGVKDLSYMSTGAVEGFGDLCTLVGPVRLENTAPLPSLAQGRIHGRLNSPYDLTLRGITSTGLMQPSNLQDLNNAFNTPGKFQPSLPANQSSSFFQGIPASLEANQLQQTKSTAHIGDIGALNNPTGLATFAGGSSIVPNSSSKALMFHGDPQKTHNVGPLGNQSSLRVAALHPNAFDLGINGSSNFLDHNRCSESWQGAVQSSKFPSTALPMSEPSNQGKMHCNNLVVFSATSQIGSNPHEFASTSAIPTSLGDSKGDEQGRDGLIGNIVHTTSSEARQGWEEHEKDYKHILKQNLSAINSLLSAKSTMGQLNQSLDQNNAACGQSSNASIIDQLNGGMMPIFRSNEIGESAADTTNIDPSANLFGQAKAQDAYGSLDDIINAFTKQQQNETTLTDGELGFDICALDSCISDFIA